MNQRIGHEPTAKDLMEMHARVMFTHDLDSRMRTINEPWPGEEPAPRFFLGRTIDGSAVCRLRYDIQDKLAEQLTALVENEPSLNEDFQTRPKHFDDYMNLLAADQYTSGPCYRILDITTSSPNMQAVSITGDNITEYSLAGLEWLNAEIDYAQPCVAIIQDQRVVSVCRSVRVSAEAHEAGLETLTEFRGRGYAAAVAAGWAIEVRKMGALPLYSTSWDNASSQRVAGKLALSYYGVNFTIR